MSIFKMHLRLILMTFSLFLLCSYGQKASKSFFKTTSRISFNPENLTAITEKSIHTVIVSFCSNNNLTKTEPNVLNLTLGINDQKTVKILDDADSFRLMYKAYKEKDNGTKCQPENFASLYEGNFSIQALRLGIGLIEAQVSHPSENIKETAEYRVTIIREIRFSDDAFNVCLVIFLILTQFGFGIQFDLQVAKEIFRVPLAFIVGFSCQIIMMPLLAFSIIKVFNLPSVFALGLFIVGCSPGGGQSNIWTYILEGDLTLSVIFTCSSMISAFGTMPFWLFTLGKHVVKNEIKIPYQNIIFSLLMVILPLIFGIIVRKKAPRKVLNWLNHMVKVVICLFIVFMFTLGIYSKLYALQYLFTDYKLILACCSLPLIGSFLAAIVSLIFCQEYKRVATISVEAAYQNSPIALVIFNNSLGQPDSDLASIFPVSTALCSPLLFVIAALIRKAIIFFKQKNETSGQKEEDKKNVTNSIEKNSCDNHGASSFQVEENIDLIYI